MSVAAQTLRPPSRTLMFLEGRALPELGAFLGALPLLGLAPHARNAAPSTRSCSLNSARRPARRCGAARPAANPLTISSVTDHEHTALSSPSR